MGYDRSLRAKNIADTLRIPAPHNKKGMTMARLSDEEIVKELRWVKRYSTPGYNVEKALRDLHDCRSMLNDLLARMVDKYDGPDGNNEMPFTGSDIEDIRRVVE